MVVVVAAAAVCALGAAPAQGAAARLYSSEDPAVVILGAGSLRPALLNSSSAWLLQFYSSWCGHCISYSPTWKSLARDVKGRLQAA